MTSWFEQAQKKYAKEWYDLFRDEIMDRISYERTTGEFFRGSQSAYKQYMAGSGKNKEENTMMVSYKGVTGKLIRLECVDMSGCFCTTANSYKWELDIWDNEKGCKVSFSGVFLKDVKFLGGEVTYG